MVFVVQYVHQIRVKRTDVVKFWEVGDLHEPIVVVLLGERHLSHIKVSDMVDLAMFVYHCGCFTTVGVLLCVLDNVMSMNSLTVGIILEKASL